jgi:hypothetical protein
MQNQTDSAPMFQTIKDGLEKLVKPAFDEMEKLKKERDIALAMKEEFQQDNRRLLQVNHLLVAENRRVTEEKDQETRRHDNLSTENLQLLEEKALIEQEKNSLLEENDLLRGKMISLDQESKDLQERHKLELEQFRAMRNGILSLLGADNTQQVCGTEFGNNGVGFKPLSSIFFFSFSLVHDHDLHEQHRKS